ncbi:hypothetical protein, partial [Pseudomonas fragi]|uniref:hypothetical protein n=1 Tax=Pseudomonas fragi TaxID=296 RepID=UPI0020064E99
RLILRFCGWGLARVGFDAVYQVNRAAPIASKPAPTRITAKSVNNAKCWHLWQTSRLSVPETISISSA